MSDPGGIRNIEELQETDQDARGMPKGVTIVLVALGGACVVFAGLALGGRTSQAPLPKSDPLGDLVLQRSRPAASSGRAATDLSPKDVTFPGMLSDDQRPPTALAAIRGGSPAPSASGTAAIALAAVTPVTPSQPPPPTDRLPVVPLPAQAVLEATPIVTRPRDALTKAASDAAQIDTPPTSSDAAPAGHEGGYQLQVSSFRAQGDAQGFADQLRARGHKAYVVEAHVPGRGTWFRVRVGPFSSRRSVEQYRTGFEAREHVVPFIVAPDAAPKPRG